MKAAQDCAKFLLQINAIKLNPSNPFTWASGLKSPIYCDNRKSLSYHEIRTFIKNELANIVTTEFGKPDVIAGVATGAIAQGALVADLLGLPFVYVRSEEKKHGLANLIEGVVAKGQSVVVIEDLISTGQSSLKACEALREAGCDVKGMVAIFTYELPIASQRFIDANVHLRTITSYSIMIEEAAKEGYVKPEEIETLASWKLSPQDWSDMQK
jgi:orotate phosphoribosyltransferase